jgi:hypothetical protein
MMDVNSPRDTSRIIALLCIGDVSPADGDVALPLTPLFGQPMIHHMIKALQRLGIDQFYVGVDSVPGALLSYRDAIAKEGLDLSFVREPSAVAALFEGDMRALVLRADTIWDVQLVERALQHNRPLIATVEERAENQIFERIDLNNRWAGMAILERGTLDALTQLPEGWDMASALLRQALQDDVKLWPLKQNEIQTGSVRRIGNAGDLAAAQSALMASPAGGSETLESRLLSPVLARFAPAIWSVSWGPGLAEFGFPGLAAVAALLAIAGFPVGASVVAAIAVLSSLIRSLARSAEYRADGFDWIGLAGWGVLSAALMAVLHLTEKSLFEAGFLGLTLTGLSLISVKAKSRSKFRLLSPLVIALGLIGGAMSGATGWAVKLMILLAIATRLLDFLAPRQNPTTSD